MTLPLIVNRHVSAHQQNDHHRGLGLLYLLNWPHVTVMVITGGRGGGGGEQHLIFQGLL